MRGPIAAPGDPPRLNTKNSIGSPMGLTAVRPRPRGRHGFFRTDGTPCKPVMATSSRDGDVSRSKEGGL